MSEIIKSSKIEIVKTLIAGGLIASAAFFWDFIFDWKETKDLIQLIEPIEQRVEILEEKIAVLEKEQNGFMQFHFKDDYCLTVSIKGKYYCLDLFEVEKI